jgi:hypothetical protein
MADAVPYFSFFSSLVLYDGRSRKGDPRWNYSGARLLGLSRPEFYLLPACFRMSLSSSEKNGGQASRFVCIEVPEMRSGLACADRRPAHPLEADGSLAIPNIITTHSGRIYLGTRPTRWHPPQAPSIETSSPT